MDVAYLWTRRSRSVVQRWQPHWLAGIAFGLLARSGGTALVQLTAWHLADTNSKPGESLQNARRQAYRRPARCVVARQACRPYTSVASSKKASELRFKVQALLRASLS